MMRKSMVSVLACVSVLALSSPATAKPVKSTTCGAKFDKTIDGKKYECTKCTTTTSDCDLSDPPKCTITTETTTDCLEKAAAKGGARWGLGQFNATKGLTVDPGTSPVTPGKQQQLQTTPGLSVQP